MSSTTHTVCDFCGFDPNTRGKRLREFQNVRIEGVYKDVCHVCWGRGVDAIKQVPGAPKPEEIVEAVEAATAPLQVEIDRLQKLANEVIADNTRLAEETRRFRETLASDAEDEREFDARVRRLLDKLSASPSNATAPDPLVILERVVVELRDEMVNVVRRADKLDKALAEERKETSTLKLALARHVSPDAFYDRVTEVLAMLGKKARKKYANRITQIQESLALLGVAS